MNLLTVDWDFFFPRPSSNTIEALNLYDWGHAENMLYITMLWDTRAAGFINAGKELPMVQGWQGWWEQFRFSADVELFAGESHGFAVQPEIADDIDGEVWLFDAHHDCGYNFERAAEAMRTGQWSCEEWMLYYYHTLGAANVHMRYPTHRVDAFEEEQQPAASELDRKFYDPTEPLPVFDRVYICRSGAWVPPWCDDAFEQWMADFGSEPTWIGPIIKRDFDPEAAKSYAAQVRMLIDQHGR